MPKLRKINQPTKSLTWESILEDFLLFKRSQGSSPRTIEDYQYHVSRFFNSTGSAFFPPEDLLHNFALRYFADSAEAAPATYNTRRKTLKAFFNWTIAEEIIGKHPMDGIGRRREEELPRSVDLETIKALLAMPDKTTWSGLRDYALILLTMDCGIRPSEVRRLLATDFNLKGLQVTIRAEVAKTRVSRTLPIAPVTVEAIRRLIAARHPGWPQEATLFCSENGNMLDRCSLARRLRKYSDQLGIKVTPYQLRHSFALLYLRNGGNAFALQRMMGHTEMAMTRRYVVLAESDLKQQHDIASPVNLLVSARKKYMRNRKI
jgi:site-specific recombinase XerD